jgi:sigma-B regulation protein RsbU (phosphoserine phosphatase)
VTEAAEARVDLAVVVADPDVAALLLDAAASRGIPLYVAGPGGRVVGSFGPPGWTGPAPETIPTDLEEAAARGLSLLGISVYDEVCGFVASAAARGEGREAARAGAALVAAFATRQYETESLSKSLLDVFEEVNLFYGITARLHQVGSTEGLCQTILERACEIVRAARASILLADPHTGVLRIVASHGMSPEQAAAVRVRPGEGIVGKVMATGQACLVDDAGGLQGGGGKADDRYASRSFISVPIRVFHPEELSGARGAAPRQGSLGVLNMTDKADGARFTSGDLKLLSALASQAAVLLDNTRLAGMEKEMGLARTIQASLLPQSAPRIAGAELAGICLPARNVGGDYFDMLALPGGKAALLIADVSGHNVGAALMMAVSRAALRAEIARSSEPEEILGRTNNLLDADLARSELFVSVFLAVYDPATATLAYANAGHNLPMLRRARTGAVENLDAEGILFGVMGDMAFQRRTTTLEPGDLLLLYTDGLTEARNPAGEMFEEGRLAAAFGEAASRPTGEIPGALIAAVDAYSAAAPADDRTAAVLRAVSMGGP